MPRAQVVFVAQAGLKFCLFSLTLQRYIFFIAVHEYFARYFFLRGQNGQGQNGQNRKRMLSKPPL
jgi:hypothetical protein